MVATERISIGRIKGSGAEAWLAPIAPGDLHYIAQTIAGMEPWSRYPYSTDSIAANLAKDEPGAPRLALMSGDCVTGAVCLRWNWLRGPYIQTLAVLPPYQGCGLGGLFLGWLEAQAETRNDGSLWVCASEFNADALAFYERHGFQRVATLDGLVSDGIAEILLRKRLG